MSISAVATKTSHFLILLEGIRSTRDMRLLVTKVAITKNDLLNLLKSIDFRKILREILQEELESAGKITESQLIIGRMIPWTAYAKDGFWVNTPKFENIYGRKKGRFGINSEGHNKAGVE
ncbi:hypothetical protein RhiirA1_473861 [Rhizophagus irregularis]|uniref:Uncharacterized protein n=1 Tax=Rhizophagus irregularis TaxID=588596 RepID=A0A2N0QZV1_9GLOM|nr:hypothetical protein RhiirA1_473861 [Rhizophagus irregularis]